MILFCFFFFFQAEDGIRDVAVTGVQTCALPISSVVKTNRCVVAEVGWPHCGIGAQVVDIIQRDAFDSLDAPVLRVTQADVPMPYNKQLERAAKPSPEKIVAAARRVCYLARRWPPPASWRRA